MNVKDTWFNPMKKARLGIIVGGVIILACLLVYLAMPYYARHTKGDAIDFQVYAPTVLPKGLHVNTARLAVADQTSWYEKSLILTLSNSLSLGEKATPGSYRTTCANAPENARCHVVHTPRQNSYLVETSFVDGNGAPTLASDQMLQWTKGSTYFYMTVSKNMIDTYTERDWSAMIDSLQPTHYDNILIDYIARGQG